MAWSADRSTPLRRRNRPVRRHRFTPSSGGLLLEPRVLLSNVDVLQYRNDPGNTGQNLLETALTPSNVNPADFGKLYQYPVDGYIYAQPLYVANLAVPGQGTHNVVFVATEHDSVYAFDANGNVGVNGTPLWHDSFINPAAGITTLSQGDVFGVGDIVPEVGITATPVINPSAGPNGALYVVTKTKDMENGVEHIVQQLHALDVATGAELFGGPVMIADTTVNADGSYTYNSGPSVAGTGDGSVNGVLNFNSLTQNERGALVLNNGVIYLSYSSHGDVPPNHGWVLGYNATTLQQSAVLCTTPNGTDGTIWGGGEALAVDPQGNMYLVTGNGTFDTTLNSSGFPSSGDYGDSVVKIAVDPSSNPKNPNINGWGLKVLDYFTPSDQQNLNNNDTDYGSGGPLLLPATSTGPQVLVTAGKEGTIYVLNTGTGKMGKFNSSQNYVYQEIQGQMGGIWGAPAYWNGSIYYGPVGDYVKAFQVHANNMLSTSPTSTSPEGFGYPGPNPAVSANGSSSGIVWAIDATAYGGPGPAVLHAYDATNLQNELYSSSTSGSRDQAAGAVKFVVPTITNGQVFVGGEYALSIYGEIGNVVLPAAPSQLVATALSSSQITLTWKNHSANETGFTIERSSDGVNYSPVATISAYLTSYTDTGLSPLTTYHYKVVASNAAGSSLPSNAAQARTKASTLPAGWTQADIGGPSYAGSASYARGVYTVTASGNDIWNSADQFHFTYTTMTGDGTIVAEIASEGNTDPWAKAGVMIRQSLDADSPFVDAFVTPGNGVDMQWRPAQGAGATWGGNIGVNASAPYWVKLVRAGTSITGYASADGHNWTNLGSIVVPMSTQVYVGLSLTAHNDAAVNTSTFSNVQVTTARSRGYVAIEAGGGPTGTYQADTNVSGGYTAQTGASIDMSNVTDPAPMAVYQSERYGTFTYTMPNLNRGQLYTVRLHFSENFDTYAGQRVFDVSINGTQVLSSFDILAATGAMDTAIVEQFSAQPNASGQMIIAFNPTPGSPDQNAKVDGIELVPVHFNGQIVAQAVSVAPVQGQAFTGTVATFVDSDPGGLAGDYIATIKWGDGSTSIGTIQPDPSGTGFDVVGSHTYSRHGRVTLNITIQSANGAGVKLTNPVTVALPAASPVPASLTGAGGVTPPAPFALSTLGGVSRKQASVPGSSVASAMLAALVRTRRPGLASWSTAVRSVSMVRKNQG